MIETVEGNLLASPVEALVNTVNTEGVMGKGIALQFRRAYPEMFAAYEAACAAGRVRLGSMHVFDLGGLAGGPRWIINFPTKGRWRSRSKLSDIVTGLRDLVATVQRLGIRSVAVPPLGCGNGGLDWAVVRPEIEAALGSIPEVRVLLYPPAGAPAASAMVTRTAKPAMTKGRAALIGLVRQYQTGLLDPYVTLLEIHKLMYFLQAAGEDLKLQFEKGAYGPYAKTLRQVMIRLEGHWLSGYGDGEDAPLKPIELIADAAVEADRFLASQSRTLDRMARVAALIDGFEDPYGMELLSSVHWVMRTDEEARESVDAAVRAVQAWSSRKRAQLAPEHLRSAWQRLRDAHWDLDARGAAQ